MTKKPTSKNPFILQSTKVVYANPWIKVREDKVTRPDGSNGIFGIVDMIPGSSILPIDENNYVYLSQEYKYAVGRNTIEVFSGGIEQGEEPIDAAKRELEEELGMTSKNWQNLSCVDPFTTVISSPNHMFIAKNLQKGVQKLDAGENIKVIHMPFAKALDMVINGEITHAASCTLILKAAQLQNK